ncbi:hypothetical protein P3S67_014335 [Capsicum chacoense]
MKRDFTWVQSSYPLWNSQISVPALKTAMWDDSIDHLTLYFDDEPIFIPESESARWNSKTELKTLPITKQESRVHIYGITSDDYFAHLEFGFKFVSLSDDVNGVLGQTYRKDCVNRVKVGALMPIMGGDKKFAAAGLFDVDCSITNFKQMETKLTFPKLC